MNVQRVGMHRDAARAVGYFMKIQHGFFAWIAGDNDIFRGCALFVNTELIGEGVCTA